MTTFAQAPGSVDADWWLCVHCRLPIYRKRLERAGQVCPECGHHLRLTARARLTGLLDGGSLAPIEQPRSPDDPLEFTDTKPYRERLAEARRRTGLPDAALAARGTIGTVPVVVLAMEFDFMGGSLGVAVGRLITAAADVALAERRPLVLVCASGGARMQEGVLALMQMATTSRALAELDAAGVATVSVVTDPTFGGVAASFATLGDVIVAEPGARMGFAGPRVIEKTISERLPENFQSAEFLLEHGQIDMIVPRGELRATLVRLLTALGPARPSAVPADPAPPVLVTDPDQLHDSDPWETVRIARDLDRPTALDQIAMVFDGFEELHGDRLGSDCPATVGGVAMLDGRPVMVIGQQKGHTAAELRARNFGMPVPAGYRKAARLLRLAEKAGIPVVTLIDTGGAYPGVKAEKTGQAVAIAENLRLMSRLAVPVVAVVLSEGGSGGALGLAVADRVVALSSAVYSVISPEGCAAILWRDAAAGPEAARALGVHAPTLLRHGVVDGVIPEPEGGAQADPTTTAARIGGVLRHALAELRAKTTDQLLDERSARFRRLGGASDPGGSRR